MLRIVWLFLVILVTVRSEPEPKLDFTKDEAAKTIYSVEDMQQYQGAGNLQLVTCYSCTDCELVLYNTTVKTCPYNPDSSKMHKCVTYVEKYKYIGKPWYIRGCASERGTCSEIKKAHDEVEIADDKVMTLNSCLECEGERCNGVSRSLPIAFLSLVMTPIVAKLVVS